MLVMLKSINLDIYIIEIELYFQVQKAMKPMRIQTTYNQMTS